MMGPMRTTLNLDDDLVEIAKQLAEQRGLTAGQVISDLIRQALEPRQAAKLRNGVPLFEAKAATPKPHLALVNRLRDGP